MHWKDLLGENKIQEKSISAEAETAYQLAYEAMLIGGRALMFSCGVKPRTVGSHKITIEFCGAFLGKKYDLFIEKLDRARKKRHYLIYGIGQIISATEAANLLEQAKEFLRIIQKQVRS